MQQIPQRLEILLWNIAIPIMRLMAAVRQALPLPESLPRWDYKKLALLITAFVCAAGFTLYRLVPLPALSLPVASREPAAWKPGEQRNLLVIGVDRLNAAQPVLESAWLVLYTPGVPHFSFIPLFPLQDSDRPDLEQAIQAAFQVDRDKTPGATFLNALRSSGAWWNHYLLIDELALAELIDLSASPALPERLTGLQLVADSLDRNAAHSPVSAQARLISAVCRGAVNPSIPQDIDALRDRLSEHLNTDMKTKQFVNELRWLAGPDLAVAPDAYLDQTGVIQSQGAAITCEFPTIQDEITFKGGHFGYP
jgi:hypothetical protein